MAGATLSVTHATSSLTMVTAVNPRAMQSQGFSRVESMATAVSSLNRSRRGSTELSCAIGGVRTEMVASVAVVWRDMSCVLLWDPRQWSTEMIRTVVAVAAGCNGASYHPTAPHGFGKSRFATAGMQMATGVNVHGGGAPSEMCAPVGSFTQEYRDDTDKRSGGCRMSWMLSVPNNSPQWLRDVQLCYHWYPDGDGGQCGGDVARDLCAVANTWTSYYCDDTDRRSGGCRMSWELRSS